MTSQGSGVGEPALNCKRCGDPLLPPHWREKIKAWFCPGCATPATLEERARFAATPKERARYLAAARKEKAGR